MLFSILCDQLQGTRFQFKIRLAVDEGRAVTFYKIFIGIRRMELNQPNMVRTASYSFGVSGQSNPAN